jgi:hypothetical protein
MISAAGGNMAVMREVLTCPGCLRPFGLTSRERYEQLQREASVQEVPVPGELRAGARIEVEQLPVVMPDPAGGYRCPRCGHVVA